MYTQQTLVVTFDLAEIKAKRSKLHDFDHICIYGLQCIQTPTKIVPLKIISCIGIFKSWQLW